MVRTRQTKLRAHPQNEYMLSQRTDNRRATSSSEIRVLERSSRVRPSVRLHGSSRSGGRHT
jgi:hypothetical protein